jgi:hypothetical protein
MSKIVALNGLKEEFSEISHILCEFLTSPKKGKALMELACIAMEMLQANETYLDDDCLIALCDLFHTDASTANMYGSLVHPSTRKTWVLKHLHELGFPDFPE